MTVVVVTGGRDLSDYDLVYRALDSWHSRQPIVLLVHGAAQGADTLCARWAMSKGIETARYPVTPAEWRQHGMDAGKLRNGKMLAAHRFATVLAFPGGKGTQDCVDRALAREMEVHRVIRVGPSLLWRREGG